MPFLSRRLETKQGPALHVATVGAGSQSIVFLHGIGRRGSTFQPMLPWLSERWFVHLVDHRGHGKSDRGKSYLVADYLADTTEILSRLGEKSVLLYGHSLGALVAAMVAGQLPDRVRAVVLEDPPSPAFLANLKQSVYCSTFEAMHRAAGQSDTSVTVLARQLADSLIRQPDGSTIRLGDLRDPVSLRFSASCLRDVDPAVYEPLLAGRWLDGIDWWDAVRTIRCPVLLLHGDVPAGGMLPTEDAARIADCVPDLTRMHLKGAGHVLHWQHTGTVANHLLAFLDSL